MEENIPSEFLLLYKVLFAEYFTAQQETISLLTTPRPDSTMWLFSITRPRTVLCFFHPLFPLYSLLLSPYLSIQTRLCELHSLL